MSGWRTSGRGKGTGKGTNRRSRTSGGFTLVELLVVMAMLSAFLMFLTRILSDALTVWQRGEDRVSLAARAAGAIDMLTGDFRRIAALSDRQFSPSREGTMARARARGDTPAMTGRLYAHWVAFVDTKRAPAQTADEQPGACDWFPEVRFVGSLDGVETDAILRARIKREIEEVEGNVDSEELRQRIADRLRAIPPRHPAEIALRVLPTGAENGCYLAMFREKRLLGPGTKQRWVDGAELPPAAQPLLSNLLYVEFLFRSQFTQDFAAPRADRGGPEHCWDSARAGTFPDEHPVLAFSLDLDDTSLYDPLDDVMPAAIEVRVVVDEGPGLAYTALLARKIDAKTSDIRLEYPERLPLPEGKAFLKIGGEWIRYTAIDGSRLIGVRRGARFTKPRGHESGSRVHAGKEATIRIPIAVVREYWNR